MSNWKRQRVVYSGVLAGAVLLGVVLAAVAGCGARMARPEGADEGMLEFETDGRSGEADEGEDARFSFGPYKVTSVKRNRTIDDKFELAEDFKPAPKRGYSFSLTGGADTGLAGRCNERAPKEDEESPALACRCDEEGAAVSSFFIEDLAGEYNGPVAVGGVDARIRGAYYLEGGELVRGRPMGYQIEDTEGAVAAADVVPGESRIWMRKGLGDTVSQGIACALVGLMLWVPPPLPESEENED